MPVAPACPIVATAAERKQLKKMAYGHKGATGYGTEALQVSACTARADHDQYQ
jgi:hypothetical protein